jgi:hypothetical protein
MVRLKEFVFKYTSFNTKSIKLWVECRHHQAHGRSWMEKLVRPMWCAIINIEQRKVVKLMGFVFKCIKWEKMSGPWDSHSNVFISNIIGAQGIHIKILSTTETGPGQWELPYVFNEKEIDTNTYTEFREIGQRDGVAKWPQS